MTGTLDDVDLALLAEIQKHLPVDHRPFQVLGHRLGMSEQDVLERLGRLKARRVIERIAAVFDASALGYQHALVAMKVGPSRVDEAARIVTQYPGVWRIDRRNDPFPLWCNIAVPPGDSLEQVLHVLQTLAKVDETIVLSPLKVYKAIGKRDPEQFEGPLGLEDAPGTSRRLVSKPQLSGQDLRVIRILQGDLPLLEMPFTIWAEQAETTEAELFAWIKRAEHLGYVRRIGGVATTRPSSGSAAGDPMTQPGRGKEGEAPGQFERRRSGMAGQALVVWQVPDAHVDAVGELMALFREVSHCSRRPVFRDWPYSLFSLVQAQTDAACVNVIRRIEERVGCFPHKHLFTITVYQHRAIPYFSPELDTWWDSIGGKVQPAP